MGYKGLPEQKRLLKRFKKSYVSLSQCDKVQVIKELKEAFEIKNNKTWLFSKNNI